MIDKLKLLMLAAIMPVATANASLVYNIGNSLTWDSRPVLLDGQVEYHIDCAKNLQDIFDNPASPCVGSSRIWTDALANTQYDFVTVQPYLRSTLEQDATVISAWMALQPNAQFIIHTGWTFQATRESAYHGGVNGNSMVHAPEYFDALIAELHTRNPGRTVSRTRSIDVLDSIYHDIENNAAPLTSFSDLYRDSLHMSLAGQYLMHNVLRQSLGQPLSSNGFERGAILKCV